LGWQTTVVVVHLFTVLACANSSESGNPMKPTAARLDQPFTLSPGASVVFDAESLQLDFVQVAADSRCPRGAQCITEGEATVRVSLSKSARAKEERDLKTNPAASEAVYDAYRISLVMLEPYPAVDRPIRPSDYVATMLVTRSR